MIYTADEVRAHRAQGVRIGSGSRAASSTSVDKANVLAVSRLWRQIGRRGRAEYPDVTSSTCWSTRAAMHLMRRPVRLRRDRHREHVRRHPHRRGLDAGRVDGHAASASLGEGTNGVYEPIHGSAPDIAGKGIANPLATILSVALLLRYSLGLEDEAKAVEAAVVSVLEAGDRTPDIAGPGVKPVGTTEMGDRVVAALAAGK